MIQSGVFQWKDGAKISKISAQKAGERFDQLRAKHGEVTPALVVDDARPVNALLHPLFEWNNTRAADQYRLYQARHILNSIVTVNPEKPDAKPMRYLLVVNETGEGRSYVPTPIIMSDAQLRAQVISRALREARAWQARYQEYMELAAIFAAIEEVSDSAA